MSHSHRASSSLPAVCYAVHVCGGIAHSLKYVCVLVLVVLTDGKDEGKCEDARTKVALWGGGRGGGRREGRHTWTPCIYQGI